MPMSIQERQDVVAAPRQESGEVLHLTFAEAADISAGPYDTAEQQADRRLIAERLQAAMQPGAAILHQVDKLDVRGGILLEPPSIVSVPRGNSQELAIGYTMWQDNAERQGTMRFSSIGEGVQYGAKVTMPLFAAGREGVMSMVRHGFVEQWDREHQPGGLHWADQSDLTQLRTFEALVDTDVRLSDVLEETLVIRAQDQIISRLQDPREAHMHPTYVRGLLGTAHITPADAYALLNHYLADTTEQHRDRVLQHVPELPSA